MVLSVAKIEDFDRFWQTFSTKGAAKRKEHGSKGAHVFRDPDDPNRVLVLIDWDTEAYKGFIEDPEMQEVFKEGGLQERPRAAELAGEMDS